MLVLKYDQDPTTISQALEVLRSGGVVIYPTDTLYGMGCDAGNPQAINKVYNIKKLSKRKPLSLLCSDLEQVAEYAQLNNDAFKLMRRVLPGPYTFILPATRKVPRIIMNNKREVGIRVPDNPICLDLIRELGNPIMNTSATYESDVDEAPNDPELIQKFYPGADVLIDCGSLEYCQSSVLDMSTSPITLIRRGKGDVDQFLSLN